MSVEAKTLPWKIGQEEFTSTDHQITIERTLNSIYNDRLPVVVVSGDYRSDKMVLNSLETKNMLIARPDNWNESLSSAKVFFLDTFKVWNFFQVKIIKTTPDAIHTDIPQRIHRLQRRRHFRISPPSGSRASFRQDQQLFDSVIVNDISAGGMLVSTVEHEPPTERSVKLNEINIQIPTSKNGTGTHFQLPKIDKGEIVRSFTHQLSGTTFFAVSFAADLDVKDEISKYVIQREQEILRKNLKSIGRTTNNF